MRLSCIQSSGQGSAEIPCNPRQLATKGQAVSEAAPSDQVIGQVDWATHERAGPESSRSGKPDSGHAYKSRKGAAPGACERVAGPWLGDENFGAKPRIVSRCAPCRSCGQVWMHHSISKAKGPECPRQDDRSARRSVTGAEAASIRPQPC